MKKVLLVVNPSSGGEQAKEFEQLAIAKLESVFDEVVVLHTKKAGDAKNFTREAATEGYHSVFVMGGDGTVNEGISGEEDEIWKTSLFHVRNQTVSFHTILLVSRRS